MSTESQPKIKNVKGKLYLSLLAVAFHTFIEANIVIQYFEKGPKVDFLLNDFVSTTKALTLYSVLCWIIGSLLGDLLKKNKLFLLFGCCLEITGMVFMQFDSTVFPQIGLVVSLLGYGFIASNSFTLIISLVRLHRQNTMKWILIYLALSFLFSGVSYWIFFQIDFKTGDYLLTIGTVVSFIIAIIWLRIIRGNWLSVYLNNNQIYGKRNRFEFLVVSFVLLGLIFVFLTLCDDISVWYYYATFYSNDWLISDSSYFLLENTLAPIIIISSVALIRINFKWIRVTLTSLFLTIATIVLMFFLNESIRERSYAGFMKQELDPTTEDYSIIFASGFFGEMANIIICLFSIYAIIKVVHPRFYALFFSLSFATIELMNFIAYLIYEILDPTEDQKLIAGILICGILATLLLIFRKKIDDYFSNISIKNESVLDN